MNHIDDPLKIVADLEPETLDRLANEGYARNRAADLTRMLAEPGHQLRGRRRHGPGGRTRGQRRLAFAAGAGLTAAAVTAAVLIAAAGHPTGTGHPTGAGGGAPQARGAGRTVLLTAEHAAAKAPVTEGAYWYAKERDFEPSGARSKKQTFGAYYAETQETWVGAAQSRTIVDEDLLWGFASAADKARWEAAGEPALASAAGFASTGPAITNYAFGGYWFKEGGIRLNLADAGKLPTTAAGLGSMLRNDWDAMSGSQQAATTGLPGRGYAQYVFEVASALLEGPARPGTRAAVYQLLAAQPGLVTVADVTDPLGRTGVAIGDGYGDYTVIDPATSQVLDATAYPVKAGQKIPAAAGGTEAVVMTGWTGRLGTPASS